jgi:hypothetical protein
VILIKALRLKGLHSVMLIKNEDELHILMRKVYFELFEVGIIRLYVTEARGGRI